ncbi:geranylgeranyl pyrophosphate synthetase [Gnomoniopsis smithogilvyi]|uniref:Geranylgeranyl pyrophosphate synthetase n=1 Tax=Gnomoniopsis smithogilvyi TaxID=1191159 RepID=A0A9W8Z086_9PEZI|nr:geranylgeranyl pyrophosphate synthetase [Gnomoniopsis smithogilvyi]
MTPPPISTSNNFLQSPNAIPPRTSSTGQPANTASPSSRANVLRPVPEADWISQSTHARSPPTRQRQRAWSASHNSSPLYPQTNILLNMPEPSANPDPSRFANHDFGFIGGQKSWAQKQDRVIMGPFEYLNGQRGKDFRSQLIAAFNTWLDVSAESLEIITKVVGMLHTASLLIDDVEDNSILRRGLPVAHSLFGVPQTINSANYVYFYALEELQKLNNKEVITVYAEELLNLHRGQGMDLFWRDTLTCPTEDEYLEMVGNKTGGLFRLGIKLMQAESRAKNVVDCVPLVNLIGLIFQIRDDYQNLHSTEYSENKGLAEDLTEGKFSFPVIHSIRSDPGNLQLINILKQRTSDEEVKRYAVKYMEGTGTFEYTLKVLDVLIQRARKVAEDIDSSRGEGRNKGIEMILDRMVIGGKGEMHFPAKA